MSAHRPRPCSNWSKSRATAPVGPGEHGAFDLIFYGQDGQPGGEGYSADLGNWE
jgi:hypothetical protein